MRANYPLPVQLLGHRASLRGATCTLISGVAVSRRIPYFSAKLQNFTAAIFLYKKVLVQGNIWCLLPFNLHSHSITFCSRFLVYGGQQVSYIQVHGGRTRPSSRNATSLFALSIFHHIFEDKRKFHRSQESDRRASTILAKRIPPPTCCQKHLIS